MRRVGVDVAAVEEDGPTRRVYRGASTEQRQADRRRKLLDSALELYGTVGFANVSIQALCKHSGVTARHFYEAFDSRDEVLEAVHDEIVAHNVEQIFGALLDIPVEDPARMSRVGIRAFYEGMLADPRRARIAVLEVMSLPPEKALACVDAFGQIIETSAQTLQDAGLIHVESVHVTATILAGAVRHLLFDWLTTRSQPSVDDLVDITVRLFGQVGGFATD
jgi:AcrR family transcriptional regulator